ncbi:O-antigen ligase family protein [Candidatus Roizmanbacteria bacterium]|nr:O-antigen ligase family protein [Candidatus Roizmanbacteria bacterium]
MSIIFYFLAFSFSLGQLGRVSLFNNQINFYLYEAFLAIFILGLFFKYRFHPLIEFQKKYNPFFVFLGILLISLFNGMANYPIFVNVVGLLYLLRLCLYGTYWAYLAYWIRKDLIAKIALKKAFWTIVILTVASTITQYFLYPDLRNLFYLGWDPHLYRTFGVFFDTAVAGTFFGMLFLYNGKPIIKITYLIFTILSFSRSIYLALGISFFYIFFINKDFKKFILYLLVGLTLIFIAPKPSGEGVNLFRTFSISSRLEDYKEGLNLFIKKPILGYGYNRLRYVRQIPKSNAGGAFSSSYLTILVSSGLMGFIGLISLLSLIWKNNISKRQILVFVGIASLFDNVFLHPFVLFLLFTLLSDK